MTFSTSRTTHAEAILGRELHAKLADTKVLLVGAGGIGCELLKNLVLTGFGHITVLDLDTIDLSNLNRQFLFRKKDVKQSKALVAAQTAGPFNPNIHLTPIHGNIKEPQYDLSWFKSFDLVLNALDNLDARRHVNKMCMAAEVPLVESGTAGYLGQVQPLLKDRTECFDCIPKPTPKTFPVCTIRSTPSQPIHCIVWAKSYLMSFQSNTVVAGVCLTQASSSPVANGVFQLFGEDEDAGGQSDLDEAEKQGENAQEIAKLRQEQQAFKAVRTALRTPSTTDPNADPAKMAFQKVFNADIRNLLSMADMWRHRAPPTPLDYDSIHDGTFVLRSVKSDQAAPNGNGARANGKNGKASKGSSAVEEMLDDKSGIREQGPSSDAARLKDQKTLSLKENLNLFVASTHRLAERLRDGEETISFDKDDDDTLDFVTAAANLRSAAYGIAGKTRWEVKEMAGNIIPAIATTNAIISGLIVLQALHLLRKSYDKLKNVFIQFKPQLPLSTVGVSHPNPSCGVCRDVYAELRCDPARVTLGEVVNSLLGDGDGEGRGTGPRDVSVYEDKRILSDPDFDDNNDRTLESLGVTRGKFLTIVDEDDELATIAVAISPLPEPHPADGPAMILPSPLPSPPAKPKPAAPMPSTPPPSTAVKRPAPDDNEEPLPKRARTNGAIPDSVFASPSKKRKLDEDGLVMLDTANEELRDDVIEID
ncbi:hypothetical protein PUNSTDRAFT_146335 [Punctularia strigosozonata HHB-11173 SS5]|uniref:Ubiquitin-activating enzyme E1-like n=1 Tax=Punctularia strigosozonata (strain HHB-11173) TaxID=741275 RepID=R7S4E8_PUNST|nr:uncharacterized protein PUNSTDRAFT_146335 [Punctularia strigosozonata HHB-11173 SS5]EIN04677.1 hypothetical protein PUNSTDRAFT_146335 [Punctularia strigosozonata HHB-11173 SS5]